jgi:hypothetical protein
VLNVRTYTRIPLLLSCRQMAATQCSSMESSIISHHHKTRETMPIVFVDGATLRKLLYCLVRVISTRYL